MSNAIVTRGFKATEFSTGTNINIGAKHACGQRMSAEFEFLKIENIHYIDKRNVT
jgi:hypothetical protein